MHDSTLFRTSPHAPPWRRRPAHAFAPLTLRGLCTELSSSALEILDLDGMRWWFPVAVLAPELRRDLRRCVLYHFVEFDRVAAELCVYSPAGFQGGVVTARFQLTWMPSLSSYTLLRLGDGSQLPARTRSAPPGCGR